MPLATMTLNADGTAVDASPAALELLGVSLDQLRALPRGAFSPEPEDVEGDAAFRKEWEGQGSPDIGGNATIQRLDGTRVRVRFGITPIDDGRLLAILEPTGDSTDDPTAVYTAGQVLAEWRAAERHMADIPAGSAEWRATQAEIELFRSRYQELFRDAR